MDDPGRERLFLSTAEVALLLAIAPRTVCLWAECSELPGIKVGRQWRFRRADIQAWIKNAGLRRRSPDDGFPQSSVRRN